ncbi:hypothetical protein VTK26DRAFT_1643 [Humicola hyalothermophila]
MGKGEDLMPGWSSEDWCPLWVFARARTHPCGCREKLIIKKEKVRGSEDRRGGEYPQLDCSKTRLAHLNKSTEAREKWLLSTRDIELGAKPAVELPPTHSRIQAVTPENSATNHVSGSDLRGTPASGQRLHCCRYLKLVYPGHCNSQSPSLPASLGGSGGEAGKKKKKINNSAQKRPAFVPPGWVGNALDSPG